jgi:hypothetical protein
MKYVSFYRLFDGSVSIRAIEWGQVRWMMNLSGMGGDGLSIIWMLLWNLSGSTEKKKNENSHEGKRRPRRKFKSNNSKTYVNYDYEEIFLYPRNCFVIRSVNEVAMCGISLWRVSEQKNCCNFTLVWVIKVAKCERLYRSQQEGQDYHPQAVLY